MIHAHPHALTVDHHAGGDRHVDSRLTWQSIVFGEISLSQHSRILKCKTLNLAVIRSTSPKVNLSFMTPYATLQKPLARFYTRYADMSCCFILTRMSMTLLKMSPANCRHFIHRRSYPTALQNRGARLPTQ